MQRNTREVRTTIQVVGARQNNLQNVDVEIPRDQLTVITGVSGSGKSTLAFDVLYGEAQRRLLDSLSSHARKRIEQVRRADVDFVYGLSPVIAIAQNKGIVNPRSTVGTMTDIYSYLRLLWATCGQATCPECGRDIATRSVAAIASHIATLPVGTRIELRAPLARIYGEPWTTLVAEVRKKGVRYLHIDGARTDLSDDFEWDDGAAYALEAEVERITLDGKADQHKNLTRAIENAAMRFGEGFLRLSIDEGTLPIGWDRRGFLAYFGCPEHGMIMPQTHPFYFSFNDADSACRTCAGIGLHKRADARLVVEKPKRSLRGGALNEIAYRPSKSWGYKDVLFHSLARHYGFDLDAPWCELPEGIRGIILHGTGGDAVTMRSPEGAKHHWSDGREIRYGGVLADIDWQYRRWRERAVSQTREEEALDRVMVEAVCPDCGGFRLKPQRALVKLGGMTITEAARLSLSELRGMLDALAFPAAHAAEGAHIVAELLSRIDLLLDIGLYYITLDRRSDSISGGEAQRIRLSTQIASGLMGMLYVLDEPSIGLHPRDGARILGTLRRLRDIGNTVIVVEHDMDMIAAADYIVEVGPGAGSGGGRIVATGTPARIRDNAHSLTGDYLSGRRRIPRPATAQRPERGALVIHGARQHNLRGITVSIPLGRLVCVTGVSGSGKSTLIHDILVKALRRAKRDPRILPGEHDGIEGMDLVTDVIDIDQTPIGRNARSNPATYVGFYDRICELFAATADAVGKGYARQDFSFNARQGMRCEECQGTGVIVRELQFMADLEMVCPICGGARFQRELLEVRYGGKHMAEVLDMPLEEAAAFFAGNAYIHHKISMMNRLGLGYLKLGQSSTTLSGGEAQRVKLAHELGKIKRGAHNLYVLDEPTTGLHLADIQRLMDCLYALVDAGHSVLVIEHHLDVIKCADHVIDMGPEGGRDGGLVVAQGRPEDVAAVVGSHTGRALRAVL